MSARWAWAERLGRARGSKLVGAAFVVLLVLHIALVHQGLEHLARMAQDFEFVVRDVGERERQTQHMQTAAQNRIVLLLRMLAEPDVLEREGDGRRFEAEGLAFGRARDALQRTALDEASRRHLADVLERAVALSQQQRQVVQLLLMGEDGQARQLLESSAILPQQRALVQALQDFADSQHQLTLQAQERVQQAHVSARRLLWGMGAGVFLLGLILGVGVTLAISRAELLQQREKERADHAARHDALTGLLNRRGFEHALAQWRHSCPCERHSLLLLDLDRFKPINDQAGHAAGDAVLQRLAELFRTATRPQDLIARLGGDEFAVVLRGLSGAAALEVAQRIRQTVQDFNFEWQGQRFKLGTSIGVTAFELQGGAQAWSETLRRADEACYQAKHGGRNQVVVA